MNETMNSRLSSDTHHISPQILKLFKSYTFLPYTKDEKQIPNRDGHIKSVHEGEKSIKRNICDAAYSQNQHQDGHINQFMKERSPSNATFVLHL